MKQTNKQSVKQSDTDTRRVRNVQQCVLYRSLAIIPASPKDTPVGTLWRPKTGFFVQVDAHIHRNTWMEISCCRNVVSSNLSQLWLLLWFLLFIFPTSAAVSQIGNFYNKLYAK